MWIFAELDIYHDLTPRSATMNMAIDEALLETATIPSIRFYRWCSPALSFGYFGKFTDVAEYAAGRDLVRRWTGGGIVFHGDDLTYSIVIPARDPVLCKSSISIYENVHRALRDALMKRGQHAVVAVIGDRGGAAAIKTGVSDPGYSRAQDCNGHCFANPVHADVLVNGRKVAGAAKRRTRAGLLHQGSIQHVGFANGLAEGFTMELSSEAIARKLDDPILDRACEIAAQKYGTDAWLRKR